MATAIFDSFFIICVKSVINTFSHSIIVNMVTDFSKQNSIINQFVAELRDIHVQTDRMRFRRNMERIGEIMAYEVSKELEYAPKTVETPLGELDINLISTQPILGTILRAGLPLHQGFLNYFDKADNALSK